MAEPTHLSDDPEFAQVVRDALSRLLPDGETFGVTVRERDVPDAAQGGSRRHIVVSVSGAARPLVMGQFLPFSARQLRGYHLTYVFGYVQSWYAARYGRDLAQDCDLVLDTTEPPGGERPGLCSVLALREAIEEGFVDDHSPLAQTMRRHEIEDVLICGQAVSGPSVGLLETVEEVVSDLAPSSVLELYAGTCSLARVAAACGVRQIICVDTSISSAARARLSSIERVRAEFIEQDVAQVDLRATAGELIIADPFFDFTVESLDLLLPQLRGSGRTLVMNLGSLEPANWLTYVRGLLQANVSGPTSFQEIYGECIGVARL